MLLELMSNGTLAKLPPENSPIDLPDESSVMVLLPHNKYLLGQKNGSWLYGSDSSTSKETPKNVFLYDNERLSLRDESGMPVIIPADVVTALKNELYLQMTPPGNHVSTSLILKTFMRDNKAFADDVDFQNEEIFSGFLKNDSELNKVYWALRFAMSRGEMEAVARLKMWFKAGGSSVFDKKGHEMKIWFSLLDTPDSDALNELEELNFSNDDIKRMAAQNLSPLLLFNQRSGFLVLGRFGRNGDTIFFVWIYFNSALWNELREIKKLPINEIILAAWGNYDIEQAITERLKYKP